MNNWYSNLESRFAAFPSHVQILHIVSDLQKAKNLAVAEHRSSENHLYRAIILLDYVISDSKWRSKLRECLRLREVIASIIALNAPYASLEQAIRAALLLDKKAYLSLNGS